MRIWPLREGFDRGDLTNKRTPPRIVDPRRPNQTPDFREHGRQLVEIDTLKLSNDLAGRLDGADWIEAGPFGQT
jgi:hypothetical protein